MGRRMGLQAPLAMEIGGGGDTCESGDTSASFRLRARTVAKRGAASQERAVAAVPFWLLAARPVASEAASSQGGVQLVYRTTNLEVPAAAAVEKRAGKCKSNIVVKTVSLMNTGVVPKGSLLYVDGKPPTTFEDLE